MLLLNLDHTKSKALSIFVYNRSLEIYIAKIYAYGKLAKWTMLLNEYDIMNVTQKVNKGQALTDHLVCNLVDN